MRKMMVFWGGDGRVKNGGDGEVEKSHVWK